MTHAPLIVGSPAMQRLAIDAGTRAAQLKNGNGVLIGYVEELVLRLFHATQKTDELIAKAFESGASYDQVYRDPAVVEAVGHEGRIFQLIVDLPHPDSAADRYQFGLALWRFDSRVPCDMQRAALIGNRFLRALGSEMTLKFDAGDGSLLVELWGDPGISAGANVSIPTAAAAVLTHQPDVTAVRNSPEAS